MGIDIDDIDCVYHYAINKSLTDYMQEIGRAGRKKEIKAYALTDFHPKDLDYTKVLNKLSGISQWQIKEILKKIISIYKEYHQSEGYKFILIYPDTFFNFIEETGDKDNIERNVQLALLLLERDLFEKFHDYVLNFDIPETTEVFCYVRNEEISKLENADFFSCFKVLSNLTRGSIYKLNLEEFWKKSSRDKSLGSLKYNFFKGRLLETIKVEPRIEIKANIKLNFEKAKSELEELLQKIGNVLLSFGDSTFTSEKFADGFKKLNLKSNFIADAILSFFSFEQNENLSNYQSEYKFIQKDYFGRYKIIKQGVNRFYHFIKSNFTQLFSSKQTFQEFLPLGDGNKIILALGFLELFALIDFQAKGSENQAFNIFTKDPIKIENLLVKGYFNQELDKLKKREDNELLLFEKFCNEYKNSDQAWEFLENYFLGRFKYFSSEETSSDSNNKVTINPFDGSPPLEISASDTIIHKEWGPGKVTEISSDKKSIKVEFKTVGKKGLSLLYAPIKKATTSDINFWEEEINSKKSLNNVQELLPQSFILFEEEVVIRPGTYVEVEELDIPRKTDLYYIEGVDASFSEINAETIIRADCPLGKELLGHKKGDIITIKLPKSGKYKSYRISDVAED